MSTTIDQKVVEMRFDNKQFENNVKTTMSSLERLKQSLNFKGAVKGLENVGEATNKVNMSGLGSAVEYVRLKFSALEVMGVTALMNITNSAMRAGETIIRSLTIDPIKTGFQEYETQINAVQTILANTESKGSTLEDVNAALRELNTYADQTIYNFTEMTRNIGTFTAAGVDLDTSVSAIKGIANLAAVSGSTSQQASTAMYQLSQALASGTVKLQDWNSVVNAGMGGQVFQDALKETARVHGIAIDQMIKNEGSFRETLQKGWLTSDILTETLQKFTGDLNEDQLRTMGYSEEQIRSIIKMGETANNAATKVKTFTQLFDTLKEAAQSGWTQSWEIIIGDFEEAKELLSKISDVVSEIINDSAESRNNILQSWKDLGGRKDLIEGFWNIFKGIGSILKPIKEAFRDIFPPMTGEKLVEITKGFKELTSHLIIDDEIAKKIKSTFKGLFSVAKMITDVFGKIIGVVASLAGKLFGLSDGVLTITSSFGDFLTGLHDGVKESNLFGIVIDGLSNGLEKAADGITNFINSGIKGLGSTLDNVWNLLGKIGEKIVEVAKAIGNGLSDAFENGDITSFMDVVNSGIFASILLGVKKFINNFASNFEDKGKNIFDIISKCLGTVSNVLDSVRESLEIWQTNLKVSILLKIASAIAVLTTSIVVLSTINPDKLSSSLGTITILFAELMASMSVFSKLGGTATKSFSSVGFLIGLSTAILILANALKKVSDIDIEKLKTGLLGIAGLVSIIVASTKMMSTDIVKVMESATGIAAFSVAIKILASACKDLSTLSWDQLTIGLTGVGVLMGEISLFLNTAKFGGKAISTATGIVILAGAIKILESSCSAFGDMSGYKLEKGLKAMGVLLAEIVAFTNTTGNTKHIISTGIALNLMAAGIMIMESVLEDFANFTWDGIAKGLVAIGVSLMAVTAAANLLPEDNLLMVSGALPAVTSALVVLAEAFERLGKLSWSEVARGIVASASAMTILSVSLNTMKGTIGASGAVLVASTALIVLASALSIIASSGIVGAIVSLGTLAATLAMIGIAGKLLGPLAPSILALSGSIASLGLSFGVLGVGIFAIGAGMLSLITSLVTALLTLQMLDFGTMAKGLVMMAGTFAVIGVAAKLLKPLVPTILSLSGSIALLGISCMSIAVGITLLTAGISTLAAVGEEGAKAIVESLKAIIIGIAEIIPAVLPKLLESVKVILLGIIDVAVETLPALVDGFGKMMVELLRSLSTYGPQIIDFLAKFIIDILNGLANNMPKFIEAVSNFLGAFFKGIIDALQGVDIDTILKAISAVGLLAIMMHSLSTVASAIPGAMAGVVGIGVIIGELSLVLAAIGALAQIPGLEWIMSEGGDFLETLGNALGKFVGGIAGGFLEGVSSSLPQIAKDLSDFMTNLQPFVTVAQTINPSVVEGVKALAETILILTAADILDGITSWLTGGSSISDFAKELVPLGEGIKKYSEAVSGIDESAVTSSASAAKMLAELASELPNSGGLVSFFTGDNDILEFAEKLPKLGENLKLYANEVAGIDVQAVTGSATAAQTLSTLFDELPNSGGIFSWFTGDKDLASFSEKLIPLGENLKKYSDEVTGISSDAITASATAARTLAVLVEELPKDGGLFNWFDNKGVSNFVEDLIPLGKSIKRYSGSVTGINGAAVASSVSAIESLCTVVDTISDVNTEGVSSFVEALDNLSTSKINEVVDTFSSASSKLTSVGYDIVNYISKGMSDKKSLITTAINRIIDEALKRIENKKAVFNEAGSTIVTQLAKGIIKHSSELSSSFIKVLLRMVDNIRSYYSQFQNAGAYLASGFANGISSNSYIAAARSRAMAAAAAEAARDELDEHSPSKVGYEIGDFFGISFVNALENCANKSYNAGENIANSARSGLTAAVSKIKDIFDGDLDIQPTIRPVVDLDNVRFGAGAINDMLSMSTSVGTMANIRAINSSMQLRNQNRGNDDVISAINRLRKDLGNMGSTTVNNINGITYDDGSNISDAIETIVRAAKVGRRT